MSETCSTCRHHDPKGKPIRYWMNGRWLSSGFEEYRCRLYDDYHHRGDRCPDYAGDEPSPDPQNTTIDNEQGET